MKAFALGGLAMLAFALVLILIFAALAAVGPDSYELLGVRWGLLIVAAPNLLLAMLAFLVAGILFILGRRR